MINISYCKRGGRIGEVVELSKKTQKIIATTCGVILLGILLVLALRNLDFAPTTQVNQAQQTAEKPAPTTNAEEKGAETPTKPAPTPTASTQDYNYTAVAGDSYTLLARSAVQHYATAHNLQLSNDQTLLAEATLASNAGSPLLDIGQQITIKQADIAAVLGVSERAQTAETTTPATKNSDNNTATSEKSDTPASASYTAAAGDSYTTLARAAISSYASKNKLSLTSTQRVAAESSLVAAAGAPELAIGQVVTFATASLKSATDAAKSLSANELAAWQPYATLAGL